MHIALDYTTGIYPGAGVARYTRSLVAALAKLDSENRYSLFYAARGLPMGTPEELAARVAPGGQKLSFGPLVRNIEKLLGS